MGKVIVYIGGARCGKSRLAQERLNGRTSVAYVATASGEVHDGAVDPEMQARIQRHRTDRPANWTTIEEPRDLGRAFSRAAELKVHSVLLDCLTLWLSNRVLEVWPDGWNDAAESALLQEMENGLNAAKSRIEEIVVVTNDLGGGLVPTHLLGRVFRDTQGRANQRLANIADEVYLVVAGLSVKLK